MAGKSVLIAGYPKSGNTWLGYLLSFILGAKYQEYDNPEANKDLSWKKSVIEKISGGLEFQTDFEFVYKTHDAPRDVRDLVSFDRVIHIVRASIFSEKTGCQAAKTGYFMAKR